MWNLPAAVLCFAIATYGVNASIIAKNEEKQEALEALRQDKFPDDFRFAVASASYQIEGGWDANGKGESIWDRFTQKNPQRVLDGSNGNIACDSYHKYKEDVQMIKYLGVSIYRFSLSWTRILPTGYNNVINEAGIQFYHNLIDELLKNDIEPMITMFHWDLPQPLQELGGWTNELVIQAYADYAKVVFDNFADKVKIWITINEPRQICKMGYGDAWIAPSSSAPGIADYICTKNVLKAHAEAYHLYDEQYRPKYNGKIALSVDSFWFQPNSDSAKDIEAAERAFEFYTGIFVDPVFIDGDFPARVKEAVLYRSTKQKFSKSRLPEFTPEESARIKGTADFFGLNYYTSIIITDHEEENLSVVSWDTDMRANYHWDPSWQNGTSWWLKVTPWNMPKVLAKLNERYNKMPIYITENGFSDYENTDDYDRTNYYLRHLSACLEAIDNGVNIQVYTAWTLMDNFEWTHGYVNRFGLYHVDFNDPNRARTPKLSAETYKSVVENRKLPLTVMAVPDGSVTIQSSLLVTMASLIPYFVFAR